MFPTPHKVTHTTSVKVGENAAGQPITETRTRERFVTSLRKRLNEPGAAAADADRVVVEYSMVTPESDWAHGDQVVDWRGRMFTVHGDVDDYNGGPFGFRPGYIVTLRKVVKRAIPTA
ncbi:head-to-tail stopper [Mycobacterium phage LilPharaoh]|uniref:Head-to-tail stopper n=1 Tax=Mycobacterium phage Amelie TaxID=1913035 RepID=A0A1J0GQ03_9CAUD|nr:head-tail adaptor [Mycobacterium phage Enkosi]YP_009952529.1 head-tail adaptor [Mycobacterium phage Amelie]ATN90464.1 head-to-tail stopper [Mycobacterium phage LilPharaoh]AVP42588.1 head-to-tail stopper [Mycobacterium phage SgtBeansprout]AXC37117.1 head-to-tail stopper [Mycobacterium phage Biglebops]QGJ93296.1 head-to-tail stopper [Mycobacterium phage Mdavu]UQS94412.1 head-to-tail stopper [Mycobacterium phage Nutello]UXE03173.1 head-to-tail stopper [Mycobacterium phage Nikao]